MAHWFVVSMLSLPLSLSAIYCFRGLYLCHLTIGARCEKQYLILRPVRLLRPPNEVRGDGERKLRVGGALHFAMAVEAMKKASLFPSHPDPPESRGNSTFWRQPK